jgi:hypothetical protein
MSTDPDRIRRDIESTRADLSGNVDALTNRANPKRMAEARADQARGALHGLREKIMGTASHAGEVGGAKGSSAAQSVSGAAQSARGTAESAAQSARGTADSAVHSVGDAAEKAGHSMRDAAGSARQRQHEMTQGSPLAAGLIVFGLGVLVSSLMPPSPQERHTAGRVKGKVTEHSEGIKQQVAGAAHQAQENLRQPAQQAMDSVKSRTAQGASAVQEQGRAAAQDVQGQARTAAQEVQGQARAAKEDVQRR